MRGLKSALFVTQMLFLKKYYRHSKSVSIVVSHKRKAETILKQTSVSFQKEDYHLLKSPPFIFIFIRISSRGKDI
jgi:hypothetical protein